MVTSAYLHIPFCRQKCKYCSFLSFPQIERKDEYLNALKKQILQSYNGDCLKTLYFGGGTPSLLTPYELDEIISLFNLESNAEVTLEINPETVDFNYFKALKSTKINRLSIGAQSFDDKILKNIGRKHSAKDVFNAVNNARENGFRNISLDFIYGLPEQTLKSFKQDLETACKLGVDHISLYGLKIDGDCYFAQYPPENIADEELQAQMYESAIKILEAKGFEHYEISNFARRGKYSRHNTNYWECGEYYGFGLGAHGFENGVRYSNQTNLDAYIKNPELHLESKILTEQEKLEERIFLGFRLKRGINIIKINKDFGINIEEKYKEIISKYTSSRHIVLCDGNLSLTESGILVSNYILSDFID